MSESPEVEYFAATARQFCDFVESAHTSGLNERLQTFAALLASLYAALWHLPEIDERDVSLQVTEPETINDWVGFEDFTLYWRVDDPYEWTAPATASLSDNLLGVYHDLKTGLLLMDAENSPNSAVYHWRSRFSDHWGNSAVDALRALHSAIERFKKESK